ncbi:MAG: hypothetical protein NZL91_03805 [Thermoflexales bacterium]|nr:hypothetical protein [Thermoflexales bacterium]MCS7324763.1 hypothetical protein [Thermoflexales bacterium]MCX7939353.1 hypothetical protein [Thermoflexales bacterium]MDW8053087.1 hypothetical protein [Anaerolineae bacterium]MDW8291740.1 hypothetical protein [Anaerolineae bacterium]
MIHRQTQTAEYWNAFAVTAQDIDFIYGYILEASRPVPAHELALALMRHRMEQEAAQIRRQLSTHKIYQPKQTYAEGEWLAFPALQFAVGRVVKVRRGNNPEIGDFDVIEVEMANGKRRKFAARYPRMHRLNEEDFTVLLDEKPIQTPEALYSAHGEHVTVVLNTALENHPDFIRIGGDWFLRALLVEIGVGHLNLAEAVLDMVGGGPLSTTEILRELQLTADAPQSVLEASLNVALYDDLRFVEVGVGRTPMWFLRRLQPREVSETPHVLRLAQQSEPSALDPALEALARALDDEWEFSPGEERPSNQATLILTPPHRLAGTLGWNRSLAGLFRVSTKPFAAVRLVDQISGEAMIAWLSREGRYLWGLGRWYAKHNLQPGVYIELQRGNTPDEWYISYRRQRPRRDWVRTVSIRDGRFVLETAQRTVSSEMEDLMTVFLDSPQAILEWRATRRYTVTQAVQEAFAALSAQSVQGNVHARTLYVVVNILVRSTPRSVFAALSASPRYMPLGDNYWRSVEPEAP